MGRFLVYLFLFLFLYLFFFGGGGYYKDVKSMCMCGEVKIALLPRFNIYGKGVYVKRESWVGA